MSLRGLRASQHDWRLQLLDGPNMSNLGAGGRDPGRFGAISSLRALHQGATDFATGIGVTLRAFQSNHEGALVEHIYGVAADTDAFLVNAAGLSLVGRACALALHDAGRPCIELHFANTGALGWSEGTVLTPDAAAVCMGLRDHGYIAALFGVVAALDQGRWQQPAPPGSRAARRAPSRHAG